MIIYLNVIIIKIFIMYCLILTVLESTTKFPKWTTTNPKTVDKCFWYCCQIYAAFL